MVTTTGIRSVFVLEVAAKGLEPPEAAKLLPVKPNTAAAAVIRVMKFLRVNDCFTGGRRWVTVGRETTCALFQSKPKFPNKPRFAHS